MYQGIDSIPLAYTNHYAMKDWYDEYQGDNGTALTDTITTDLFLLDFNRAMVNNYTGVRHDSGDHRQESGADPRCGHDPGGYPVGDHDAGVSDHPD